MYGKPIVAYNWRREQSMDVTKIIERLQSSFPDGPPTEDQVRGQEVQFLADHWIKRWPVGLETPDFLKPGARLRVKRQELFDHASTVNSPEDALAYFIWVLGWGTGTKAQSVGRSAPALRDTNLKEKLWRSFSTVQELGAVEAYRRLRPSGVNRIKYFGPSFFTKWIYFASYDTWDQQSPAPLILDKWVATHFGWSDTGWSPSDYGQYLELAEQIRQTWAPERGTHVVEYGLFHARV